MLFFVIYSNKGLGIKRHLKLLQKQNKKRRQNQTYASVNVTYFILNTKWRLNYFVYHFVDSLNIFYFTYSLIASWLLSHIISTLIYIQYLILYLVERLAMVR